MGFGVPVGPQTHCLIPQVSLAGIHHLCGGLTAKLQSFFVVLHETRTILFGSLTNLLNARDDLGNRAPSPGGVRLGIAWC